MFKKTMTFDDLEGDEVTETFYFNYNKKEVAELLEFGALQEYADPSRDYLPLEEQLKILTTPTSESGLSERENTQKAYNIFQDLLLDAYGEKSADNRSFNKTAALRHGFKTHVAFVEMVFEFLENPPLAAQFIENCLPQKVVKAAKEEMQKENPKLSSSTLAEMVQEADRRQQDPATRIEPGPEAAAQALGENTNVAKLADHVKEQQDEDTAGTPEKPIEELTTSDILAMDEAAFKKLDPRRLNADQLTAAFRRKTQ